MVSHAEPPSVEETPNGPIIKGAWFPMGYRESFSHWYSNSSLHATEHKVLSLMPFMTAPPEPSGADASAKTKGKCSVSSRSSPRPSSSSSEAASKKGSSAVSVDSSAAATATATASPPTPPPQPDPYGDRRWITQLVRLDESKMSLNEFSVERPDEKAKHTLVMLHGYGAGLGYYFKNFEPLSRDPDWKLYALDLPGMGRSERVDPPFKSKAPSENQAEAISKVENWFVDALEEWRKVRGIDRFTLLGHSMGGYLSVAYAIRHPGHVEKLILASPVGVPDSDQSSVRTRVSSKAAAPSSQQELDATKQILAGELRPATVDRGSASPPKSGYDSDGSDKDEVPRTEASNRLPWVIKYLWDSNISPFSIIRGAGPLGARLASGWSSRRFAHLEGLENAALQEYSYGMFRQPGSGEYALAHLLAPGAHARYPLIHRVMGLKRSGPANKPIPTTFMYGDADWMDVNGGYSALARLARGKVKEIPGSPSAIGEDGSKLFIVPRAGHNLFLDSPEEFNRMVVGEMDEVKGWKR